MSKWKMVPVDATDEMWLAQRRFASGDMKWMAMLAAAPAFEPDDAMVERALETFCCVGPTDKHAMRAALKAAFEGAE